MAPLEDDTKRRSHIAAQPSWLSLQASASVGLLLLGDDGHVVDLNVDAERILGLRRDAVIGANFESLHVSPVVENGRDVTLQPALLRRHVGTTEVFRIASEKLPHVSTFLIPLPQESGERVVLAVATERTAAESAGLTIRQRASMFAALVEHSSDAIFAKDRSGKYLVFNASAGRILGVDPGEVVGHTDLEVFDAISAQQIWAIDRRIMEGGTAEHIEEELHSGSIPRFFSCIKAPFRDERNRVEGIVGIARDVTDRTLQDHTLRESERRLSEAQRMAHVGHWERHFAQDRSDWSDETYRIYGLTPERGNIASEESIGMIHPDDRSNVLQSMQDALGGGPPLDIEYRLVRPTGEIRTVHSQGKVNIDESGRPISVFGVLQDITERRAVEDALRTSERDLAYAQRVAKVGSWRFEVRAGEITWSAEGQRLLGLCDGVTTRFEDFLQLAHPSDRDTLETTFANAAAIDRPFRIEFRANSTEPEVRCFRLVGDPAASSRGQTTELFGTIQDVTHRKRTTEERRQLHNELVASREMLADLSRRLMTAQESERRRVAHELHDDIGQVLTAIQLNLESLRFHVRPEGVQRLSDSLKVVDQAIGQVRNLSYGLWPASLDLLGLEESLSAYLRRNSANTAVIVEFESSLSHRRLPLQIEVTCFRIVQKAWTNVLRHAQATHCWVSLVGVDSQLEICVRDNGVGFDTNEAWQRGLSGEGLGLVGMKEYVQLLGGALGIVSSPGSGTTITATFSVSGDPEEKTTEVDQWNQFES